MYKQLQLLIITTIIITLTSCFDKTYRTQIEAKGIFKPYFDVMDEFNFQEKESELRKNTDAAQIKMDSVALKQALNAQNELQLAAIAFLKSKIKDSIPANFKQTGGFDRINIKSVYLSEIVFNVNSFGASPNVLIRVHCQLLRPFRKYEKLRIEFVDVSNRITNSMYAEPIDSTLVELKLSLNKGNREIMILNIE
jgi:hypothetical protein